MPPSVLAEEPLALDPSAELAGTAPDGPGRLLVRYGRLLGPLLVGYLLFDKAFAYLHLPGTPLYVGELVLLTGGLGVLAATGYLRAAIDDAPVLALLGAFFAWGFLRFLPGLRAYSILAVRDFALVYYCLFAFFTAAALARSPGLLGRWIAGFDRLLPWLMAWLPVATVLGSMGSVTKPDVPFSDVPVFTHAPGDAALAALLVLGWLWLFPGTRSARSRAAWSVVALLVITLSATQNRGGLLGVAAGVLVGLAFFRDRVRLVMRSVVPIALVLSLAVLLPLQIPIAGWQARAFSVSQLFSNIVSITGTQEAGNLNGTTAGRVQLWTLVYQRQVEQGTLVYGSGFGINLATQVGVYEGSTSDRLLRSPHNSHLDVLARTGLVGLGLWAALWLAWYWRMVTGCRRLLRRGLGVRRRVAVLCMMLTTAILVSTLFAPELEGAQVAVLLWAAFGIGAAVTSPIAIPGARALTGPVAVSGTRAEPDRSWR